MSAEVRCPRCGGRGYHSTWSAGYEERCDQCRGSGKVMVPVSHWAHPSNARPKTRANHDPEWPGNWRTGQIDPYDG